MRTFTFLQQFGLPDDIRPPTLPTISGGDFEAQVDSLAGDIVLVAIQFAGVIAIIMIIIAGYQYATSRGNDEGMGAAKRNLVWSVAALVILILSYSITATVFDFLTGFGNSGT